MVAAPGASLSLPSYPSAPPPGAPAPMAAYPYSPSPPPRRATVGSILSGMFDVWTKNFANFFVVFFVLALVNGLIGGFLGLAIYGTFGPVISFFPGGPSSSVPTAALGNVLLYAILSVLGARSSTASSRAG